MSGREGRWIGRVRDPGEAPAEPDRLLGIPEAVLRPAVRCLHPDLLGGQQPAEREMHSIPLPRPRRPKGDQLAVLALSRVTRAEPVTGRRPIHFEESRVRRHLQVILWTSGNPIGYFSGNHDPSARAVIHSVPVAAILTSSPPVPPSRVPARSLPRPAASQFQPDAAWNATACALCSLIRTSKFSSIKLLPLRCYAR